mmetsp:Transcript_2791/g.7797  ORF Transcript_2791/g.7797 Transcript_2791/m.7797 type:complete len:222 (-) Transcript_2791:652-1317(-)
MARLVAGCRACIDELDRGRLLPLSLFIVTRLFVMMEQGCADIPVSHAQRRKARALVLQDDLVRCDERLQQLSALRRRLQHDHIGNVLIDVDLQVGMVLPKLPDHFCRRHQRVDANVARNDRFVLLVGKLAGAGAALALCEIGNERWVHPFQSRPQLRFRLHQPSFQRPAAPYGVVRTQQQLVHQHVEQPLVLDIAAEQLIPLRHVSPFAFRGRQHQHQQII